MRIVCLGWGSLIWDPGCLNLKSNPPVWHKDGPYLPVEFARQSSGERITLVIAPDAIPVPVLWSEMAYGSADAAVENLRKREGTGTGSIGLWRASECNPFPFGETIGNWATVNEIDAVVWSALRPKFGGVDKLPSAEEVLSFLRHLIEAGRQHEAEKYVRRTPAQIRTRYRDVIENELGWSPTQTTG